jgi:hypothetical protein
MNCIGLGDQGRREDRAGYFCRGPRLKKAQKREIDLIFGNILVFLGPESVKFLKIWGLALSLDMNLGPRKEKNFIEAPIFLPGPVHALYGPVGD